MAAKDLRDQLCGLFSSDVAAVDRLAERATEQRQMLQGEGQRIERLTSERAAVQRELSDLPRVLGQADLAEDEAEKARIRQRHNELRERLPEIDKELEEARSALAGDDLRDAVSLSYQRAAREAEERVKAARKRRAELVRALDSSLRELEERTVELYQLADSTGDTTRKKETA